MRYERFEEILDPSAAKAPQQLEEALFRRSVDDFIDLTVRQIMGSTCWHVGSRNAVAPWSNLVPEALQDSFVVGLGQNLSSFESDFSGMDLIRSLT